MPWAGWHDGGVVTPDEVYDEASLWFADNWDPGRPLGEWFQLLADSGWAFPAWPEGCGGRGLGRTAAKEALRARRESGAFGAPNGVATFLVGPTLLTYGTPEQQQRYMPGIVSGTDRWCQLFSEPGSGSDMASLSTRAERDGDEWIVNGQKVWSSGAHFARYGILIARTDPNLPKHKGITYFLIDMEQPGVDVRPLREMTGDAAFNEVFFSDARVRDADRVANPGDGWMVAMTTLSHERDPDNPGLSETGAFDEYDLSLPVGEHAAHTAEHTDGFSLSMSGGGVRLFDRLVADFAMASDPVRRQQLMKVFSLRQSARWSSQRAAAAVKAGGQPGPEVSTLKLIGAELSRRTRDIGLAGLGAAGMLAGEEAPTCGQFQSYAMFTPANSIAGGSDEVQRNIIGERVLGLPREPGESDQRERPWSELPRN